MYIVSIYQVMPVLDSFHKKYDCYHIFHIFLRTLFVFPSSKPAFLHGTSTKPIEHNDSPFRATGFVELLQVDIIIYNVK